MGEIFVSNLQNPQSGRPVANQIVVTYENGTQSFFSYNTEIARRLKDGTIVLDEYYWNYSRTTLKYLKEFLGGTNKYQIEANVKAGIYKMQAL